MYWDTCKSCGRTLRIIHSIPYILPPKDEHIHPIAHTLDPDDMPEHIHALNSKPQTLNPRRYSRRARPNLVLTGAGMRKIANPMKDTARYVSTTKWCIRARRFFAESHLKAWE